MKILSSVLLVLAMVAFESLKICNCVVILDSGNPARFIRGAFVDVNQPEFFGESVVEKEENDFPVQQSTQPLMESTRENLEKFNKAMTHPMKVEAENLDAASAVKVCRFSRARMTSLKIQNTLEDQLTKIALVNLDESPNVANNMMGLTSATIEDTQKDFNKMIEDLHSYDQAVHGQDAMVHFQRALANFHSLQLVASKTK